MKNESEEKPSFYKTSRYDVILAVAVLALSIFYIMWIGLRQQALKPTTALIYLSDRLSEEVDLRKDRIIIILNGKMRIKVKKEKIRVLESKCPHHLCMNMGWIKYNGETIVCVPNQVLIEIKSKGPAIIDAVAY